MKYNNIRFKDEKNMKIMVVEDDIDLSELIRMYLIPEGTQRVIEIVEAAYKINIKSLTLYLLLNHQFC